MYVGGVESGVCGFYTTLQNRVLLLMSEVSKVNVLCIQGPSPIQGGRLFIWAFRPVGLAFHHQSVRGGSFVNFLGLDNYKGDCRQDAQPIPNS